LSAADSFKFTSEFLNKTSLGANDAARRVAVVTALQASVNSNTDIRSETYEYNLILCPGFPELANEMLNLSIDIMEEAMVIADTPFDKNPEDVVNWAATTARQTSRNVAYYYPHGVGSNLDGAQIFVAASGVALRTIAYSDEVSELWFAPAGTRRGMVSAVDDVGYVSGTLGTATTFNAVALNNGQRDNLYKYFTNINPIVFFPGRGIVVWGQKTSAPDASALDRINVTRLVMYVRRQLRKNTMSFVFEPNDQLTRDNLKATVDSFLGDLIVKRGLYDFATVCDTSNNTPDRIDRNEMYIDIALKPVRAAEFIYIPIRIVATGASLTG
jgi:phage tail sheath protein FI